MPTPISPIFNIDYNAIRQKMGGMGGGGYATTSGSTSSPYGTTTGAPGTALRAGSDVFGTRPAPLGYPNPAGDLASVTPEYQALIDSLSQNLLEELQGKFTSGATNEILNTLNARNIGGGAGLSQFGGFNLAGGLGRWIQEQQNAAGNQLLAYLSNQSKTATLDPDLQAQIARYNSQVAAAPDPTARGNWEVDQFNRLNRELGVGSVPRGVSTTFGGTGGGSMFPVSGLPAINPVNPSGGSTLSFATGTRPMGTPSPTFIRPKTIAEDPFQATNPYAVGSPLRPYVDSPNWGIDGSGAPFDFGGGFSPSTGGYDYGSGFTPSGDYDYGGGFNFGSGGFDFGGGFGSSTASSPVADGRDWGTPSNLYDLPSSDQQDYVDQMLLYSGIDSSLYE